MVVKQISKTYNPNSFQEVAALYDISFNLPEKGLIFILGESGSGKSTLLNILSGLDKPDKGRIEISGIELAELSKKDLADYRNTYCGIVFQEYNLLSELNVKQNIELSLQLQGQKNNDEVVRKVLEQVELEGFENRKVTELSGGQKQRVAIARAIIKNPKIIFADEPTGALDEVTSINIFKLLKNLSKEKLVIVVSHEKEFAEKYGDRIIELADGKIVSDNGANEILNETEKVTFDKRILPLKASLKIGCSNFRTHPIRLFTTIILFVITFALLGLSLNIAMMNPQSSYIEAIYENEIKHTAIYKYRTFEPNVTDLSLDQFLGDDSFDIEKTDITQLDLSGFKSNYKQPLCLVKKADIFSFQKSIAATTSDINTAIKSSDKHFAISANGYITLNSVDCEKLKFNIVGKLPTDTSEIAIPECILNTFMIKGIKEDGISYTVETAIDIIGHRISINDRGSDDNYKTVSGVVFTGCSGDCYKTHEKENFHEKIFVCPEYFSEYSYALCVIGEDFNEFKNFAKQIFNYNVDDYIYEFSDTVSDGYYYAASVAMMIKMLCLYLCLIFLLFAVILLINFIATSIRSQLKQIGILISLGAEFKQLFKIYCGSSLILGTIAYVLTLPIVAVGIKLINNDLIKSYDTLYNIVVFNPAIILLLAAFICITAMIASIISLLRLKKFSVTEIIAKGQVK